MVPQRPAPLPQQREDCPSATQQASFQADALAAAAAPQQPMPSLLAVLQVARPPQQQRRLPQQQAATAQWLRLRHRRWQTQ